MADQRISTAGRVFAARVIGVAADVIQIVLFPLFAAGAASPWNDALDLLVALAMIWLVGWHWAFLPSLFAELVPGLDLVPTWTAAVFFATRATPRSCLRKRLLGGGKAPLTPPLSRREREKPRRTRLGACLIAVILRSGATKDLPSSDERILRFAQDDKTPDSAPITQTGF